MRCRCGFPDRPLRAVLLATALAMNAGAAAADAAASAQTRALVERGDARRVAGRLDAALVDLEAAVALAPSLPERAFAAAALGFALREAGRFDAAARRLGEALEGAAGAPALSAAARAALAALSIEAAPVEVSAARAARLAAARAALDRAASEAALAAAPAVTATVAAMRAQVEARAGDGAATRRAVAEGLAAIDAAPSPATRRAALLLGVAALKIAPADAAATAAAARAFARAGGETAVGDRTAALAALGVAETALRRGAHGPARAAAGRAAAWAAGAGAEDVGFRAAWAVGRAAAAAGAPDARAAYRDAFEALRGFRARAPLGAPPVTVGLGGDGRRFQLDFIDFLLRDGAEDADRLAEVLQLAEDVKLDEIDEYFDERCAPARAATAQPADLAQDVAVIYPVALPDRLELVAVIGGRLERFTAPIAREALRAEVALLRLLIDAPRASAQDQARRLHDLLIAPLRPALEAAGARTLVLAPDGPLRALPFAALWDGETWLGERYGLATILGLSLVRRSEFSPGAARLLAAGARDPSPDYPPLPAVAEELAAIAETFEAEVLLDDAFSVEGVADAISRRGFDIVHIATHAEFGAEPASNFIVASDGRLDMTRLESILRARAVRDDAPVDLLTLSACNTAAAEGGAAAERAPLGLASVGFRAGARTVVASLWPADDAATARLMAVFYQGLGDGLGRAEALRRAQAAMIADPATADPFQWANFFLIGDWR